MRSFDCVIASSTDPTFPKWATHPSIIKSILCSTTTRSYGDVTSMSAFVPISGFMGVCLLPLLARPHFQPASSSRCSGQLTPRCDDMSTFVHISSVKGVCWPLPLTRPYLQPASSLSSCHGGQLTPRLDEISTLVLVSGVEDVC
jgi:hypothetical protein